MLKYPETIKEQKQTRSVLFKLIMSFMDRKPNKKQTNKQNKPKTPKKNKTKQNKRNKTKNTPTNTK